MKASDATRRSHHDSQQSCRRMLAGIVASLAMASTVAAANTCKEVEILQAGGQSMISLPPRLIPPREERPEAHDLASSWKCTAEDQGGDWLINCHSSWSNEVKLAYELATELAKEIRACLGPEWRQRAVRLNEQKATTFLYREGESTEFETSLQMREAPSSINIAAAVGLPHKPIHEMRAELAVIRLALVRTASVPGSVDSDPLCPQIREIVRHAASNFRDIRGAPSGKSWVARKDLAGTTACSVSESSDYASYHCVKGTYPNRGALRVEQIRLTNRVAACLGPPWEISARPRGNGVWVQGISRKDSDVEVDIRGRFQEEKLTLFIEVDREK